jgi:dsDNA-specific endonuclease/ATPase MutS2
VFFEGQKVRFVNDTGYGTVLKVEPKCILVLTDHGFENYYKPNELVLEQGTRDMRLSVHTNDVKAKIQLDLDGKQKKTKTAKVNTPEIDLHIENLLDNWQRMSNYDILQYQMRFFKNKLENLMAKKTPKIIIIHGKGEGVLKSEIRHELQKYSNIEFLDGSYLEYGIGATEIRIRYNGL